MVYLECDALKLELVQKASNLIQTLVDQVADTNRKTNLNICEQYEKISAKAMKMPNDTEELVELMKYVDNAKLKDINNLKDEIVKSKKRLDFFQLEIGEQLEVGEMVAIVFQFWNSLLPTLLPM